MCECLRNAHSGSCVCQCHSKAAYNYRRRRIDILVILAGGYTHWPDAMHIINKTPPSISASHSAKPSLSLCHHSDRKRLLCLRYPSPPNQKNTHTKQERPKKPTNRPTLTAIGPNGVMWYKCCRPHDKSATRTKPIGS